MSVANYPSADIDLVVSLDYSGTSAGAEVRAIAEAFKWEHGQKRLIVHEQNLGLRNHVLKCGDLSGEYESVIVLEDDLSVGPEFYNYAVASLEFTGDDERIAGISLYNHKTNFICRFPFEPVHDGFDNYYLQIASSWGQAWTATQWTGFRKWYDALPVNDNCLAEIPLKAKGLVCQAVFNWPDKSWLKFFITYLVLSKKYFLYPRISHSTNNSCVGSNVGAFSHAWQVPLSVKSNGFNFSGLNESLAVYDSHFEIGADRLKRIIPSLASYDLSVDLYGTKALSVIDSEYIVTSRGCDSALDRFPIGLKPIELNLALSCDKRNGKLVLARTSSNFSGSTLNYQDRNVLEFFFGSLGFKQITRNLFRYWFRSKGK